ncbi:MAG: Fe-S cluster assembly protein NifU [Desulfobacterales bacterium]|nr:Fe-S cluster assembly protein NifU [Desulfobacterales bacterium]MCP4159235.1 Fe-S cluster assembly protein NifU [Deltaproteobacteria bacterium]
MWEYTEKVKEHFLNPKNVGTIEDANGVGEVGSLSCGDALTLTINVENDIIKDAKFKTFGCASAIASSSALTEMIIGKHLDEVKDITNDDISDFLGGLPKEKMHCSVMGRDALERAIANFRGEEIIKKEGTVICECFGVTDLEINRAVTENGLTSIEEVTSYVKAGGGCANCHDDIQKIIDSVVGGGIQIIEKKQERMTTIKKLKLIEETLEREIRPQLAKDGGDIELIDIDGNTVFVKLCGSCATCQKSQMTLKNYVEAKLREFVTHELSVEEA